MVIDIDQVNVQLSGRAILRDISVRVPSGASAAIIGQSGVGKTTLLRSVAGLLQPTSGTITIGSRRARDLYGHGMLAFLFVFV